MNTREVEPEIGKRYLLGGLDPETEELDSRLLLGDPGLENQLGVVEDELVDAFVRGELSPEETEKFQRHFIRPAARRQKVAFAKRLHRYIDRYWAAENREIQVAAAATPKEPSGLRNWLASLVQWSPAPAWNYAMVGLLVVAVIGGTWALTGKLQLQQEVQNLQAEITQLEQSTVSTVWLAPGMLRGLGEVERLILPPESNLVRIQLDIGVDDYGGYRAALNDANGDELWSQSRLSATTTEDRFSVDVILPAEILAAGDYYIRLSGVSSSDELELVGRYYFRVLEE